MQKVTVTSLLVLHGGLVALTADQARRRAHLLESVENQPEDLDEGFTVYGIKHDVQFKIGEQLYIDQLDKVASPLVTVDDKDDDSGAGAASDVNDAGDNPGANDNGAEDADKDRGPDVDAGESDVTDLAKKKSSKKKSSKKKSSKKKSSKKKSQSAG